MLCDPTLSTDSSVTYLLYMQVVSIDYAQLHIGKELGRGGFGVVFEGRWKEYGGMNVAIKKAQSSENLDREIKIWGSLPRHQNIITLFGAASTELDTYLVIELATNGSLHKFLHKRKNIPSIDQSLTWASQVASAMKHLHDHDVIHRDLKSDNVLLSDKWVTKICDFGTARELTHATTTKQAGTRRWMSPEVMQATEAKINKKCDLFSYGMILFELFAHEIPYADIHDEVEVVKQVCEGKRPPIPPTLPLYLHNVLQSCWEDDPSKRPIFDEIIKKIASQ